MRKANESRQTDYGRIEEKVSINRQIYVGRLGLNYAARAKVLDPEKSRRDPPAWHGQEICHNVMDGMVVATIAIVCSVGLHTGALS